MRKFVLMFFSILISVNTFAQVQSFLRTYGIDGFNYGSKIAVLSDTTYVLMGNKTGFGSMNNVYLIHTDKNGDIIRDNVFGGNELFYATDMTVSGDTLFIITGYSLNNISHEYDAFVMWISRDLDLIHKISIPSSAWDMGKAVVADQTGNVFVASESYSFGPGVSIQVLHLDPGGNVINELIVNDSFSNFYPESMIIIGDTMLYLCGNIRQPDDSVQGLVMKVKTDFSHIDTLVYHEAGLNVYYNDITQASNNRISVTGYFTEYQDNTRKLLYHSYNTDLQMTGAIWDNVPGSHCNSIAASVFGQTVLGCYTSLYGAGNGDFMFLRFDFNAFLDARTAGGTMYDELFDIAWALDSSLVMIGSTQSYGTPVTSIMFAKTCKDYTFCVVDNMHIADVEEMSETGKIMIFPQPADDLLYIRFPEQENVQEIHLKVISMTGKLISYEKCIQGNNSIQINVSGLFPGIYLLKIESRESVHLSRFLKL
jgi:hypothetical protein